MGLAISSREPTSTLPTLGSSKASFVC